jgi:hypothetical protein
MNEAECWREVDVKRALAAEVQEAGDALLAALEAAAADRDHWVKVATGTAAMLEAREERIAELEAGLRDAADYLQAASVAADDHGDAVFSSDLHRAALAARDLLAGRAAGGVG